MSSIGNCKLSEKTKKLTKKSFDNVIIYHEDVNMTPLIYEGTLNVITKISLLGGQTC
jgi:hypothetical protein